jgi:tRNA(Ile)-lysidine synthetase-like protein
VSGGCDSVGLFHGLLNVLSKTIDDETSSVDHTTNTWTLKCADNNLFYNLHVVHFDHQQRGAESDGDRVFVQELCEKFGIPFHCYTWNQECNETEEKVFSQDSARQWRRSNMGKLARKLTDNKQPGLILTAHHADDSMESLLLKLLRGTHITSIKGMDIYTQDDSGNPILRPMLSLKKKDILEYLQNRQLSWREDSSNASNKYRRNQVRNELVPLMSEIVGGEDILFKRLDSLSRQSHEIRCDLETRANNYLNDMDSSSTFVLPQKGFEVFHQKALYLWLTRETGGSSFNFDVLERVHDKIKNTADRLEWKLSIGHGWDIMREGGILRLIKSSKINELAIDDDKITDSHEELSWRIEDPESDAKLGVGETAFSLPANVTCYGVFLSTIRFENLMFTPPWRVGRQPTKASQFLRGQKIPLHERRYAKIICAIDGNGKKHAVAIGLPNRKDWLLDASVSCNTKDLGTRRVIVTLPQL